MAPLEPARTVPIPSPASSAPSTPSTSLKRVATTSADPLAIKRAKLPSTPTTAAFKLPSLPAHLLTPSTSTVAFSSSPPRLLSSSPTRVLASTVSKPSRRVPKAPKKRISPPPSVASTEIQVVLGEEGSTLVFGRHRHKAAVEASSAETSSRPLSSTAVPAQVASQLERPEQSAEIVYLSRYASHASRVHAVLEYLPERETARLLVVGQNGLRVRGDGQSKSRRLIKGQTAELPVSQLELDFYGCTAKISFPSRKSRSTTPLPVSHEAECSRLQDLTPVSSPVQRPALSLPPSSPPLMGHGFSSAEEPETEEEESEEVEEVEEVEDIRGQKASRSSSPLSDAGAAAGEPEISSTSSPMLDVEVESPAESSQRPSIKRHVSFDIKAELLDKDAQLEQARSSGSLSPAPPAPPPEEVDLPAVLASTVVFSGSSKLSLPDLVKHMLESQPSLKEHGDEKAWSDWASEALESNKMFGKIPRPGRDSSGRPLLPHYYYNPDFDTDRSRATQLGGLVRPLRSVQRAAKPVDWRPVGSGRRRY